MDVIILMVGSFVGYIIAYNTYGKFLERKIFRLGRQENVPSKEYEDGKDFVPTKKGIIFGHHYTSIAGTGPIVGPAIGIIWGWVPAVIWVFVGSIVMGAVHDFGALVISMRNKGASISEIASRYINPRVKYIFFLVVFFELLIVVAIFGLVLAIIFAMFPQSVFPVWMEIPIALILGRAIYKKKANRANKIFSRANVTFLTIIAVSVMYLTVIAGHFFPFNMPAVLGLPATGIWVILLFIYAFFASITPVTTLLQPRDYINAWQLFILMALLVVGVFVSGVTTDLCIVAPAFNLNPPGTPSLWPFLFITIACGAISGFHSLVSSGTSSKQISQPQDALAIGYGAMLMEAALAMLAIIAVAAGIGLAYKTGDGTVLTGIEAWETHYSSWTASKGLGSKINAVVIGSANIMASLGIPAALGKVIMGVFIASFAGTTLDSATRIQRYVVSELFTDIKLKFMTNKYASTTFVITTAAMLAFAGGADGKGALKLWPMFGGVNQLLAALTLMLLTVYLRKGGGYKYLVTGIPCVFMTIMTFWGVAINEYNFIKDADRMLAIINGAIFLLAIWLIVESLIVLVKKKGDIIKHIKSEN